MQRSRLLLSGGIGRAALCFVVALGVTLAAESARGQSRQRYNPRPRQPAPTQKTRVAEPRAGSPDTTQMPMAPMPSVRQPSSTDGSVELKEGEFLIDGTNKLPPVQAVNPGNVLVREAAAKSEVAKNENDYSEIIAMCEEGIKSGANKENTAYCRKLLAWAYNRRGERFAELGSEQEAMKDFQAAISYDANHWRAFHNRGVSHATLGKTNEALNDFSRALQINRGYANTWFNRAEILSDRGDYGRALTEYSEAIRLSPKEASFYTGRGRAHARLGRAREAIEDLNAAIRLDPQNAKAHVSRGEIYLASRDWARAATDYREAIQLDDKLGPAYQGAAWIMATCPEERYRNAELAISTAQKAIELDGDADPRYIETLAAAYANAGQYASAVAILEAHMSKLPRQSVAGAQQRIQLYKSEQPYRSGTVAQQQMQQQRPTVRQPTRTPPARQRQPVRSPYQATRPVPRS
jgi:tetratricopeptide (TPR) repeat protein